MMEILGAPLFDWLLAILLLILVLRDTLSRSYTRRIVKKNNKARKHIKRSLSEIKTKLESWDDN